MLRARLMERMSFMTKVILRISSVEEESICRLGARVDDVSTV